MTETPMSFEAAYTALTEIVARLESGTLTLDESVALYEQGRALVALCEQTLAQAELRITQLEPRA